VLVADEPVSMVDASLRSSILGNLRRMTDEQDVSVVYITHDLATAYEVSDYVLVLYRGRVVEAGDAEMVIKDPRPLHPPPRRLDPLARSGPPLGGDAAAEAELAAWDREGRDALPRPLDDPRLQPCGMNP
jgi:peptide/nickel transport system ATP-binding protein